MSENMRMSGCSNSKFAAATNSHIYISHMPEDATFMEILKHSRKSFHACLKSLVFLCIAVVTTRGDKEGSILL